MNSIINLRFALAHLHSWIRPPLNHLLIHQSRDHFKDGCTKLPKYQVWGLPQTNENVTGLKRSIAAASNGRPNS